MKNNVMRILLVSAALCVAGCDTGPKSSLGFTLPDGDPEQGKAVYITFQCNTCHEHADVPQLATSGDSSISVVLGGETTRVRTYGELVTSVINPSHRVARRKSSDVADESGQSKMVNFNDVMTITQLVDLVAFLQSSYTLSPYKTTTYPVYWFPDAAGQADSESK
jgi:hypothetical protein